MDKQYGVTNSLSKEIEREGGGELKALSDNPTKTSRLPDQSILLLPHHLGRLGQGWAGHSGRTRHQGSPGSNTLNFSASQNRGTL